MGVFMVDGTLPRLKILAAASGGGHWEQMMLLRSVLSGHEVVYVTTNRDLVTRAGIDRAYVVSDCNRNTPWQSVLTFLKIGKAVLRERPDCVISTGALPGLFCVLIGRLIGSDTVWLDSVANVEKLSMCGSVAKRLAAVCLTQWEHVSDETRPKYAGALL